MGWGINVHTCSENGHEDLFKKTGMAMRTDDLSNVKTAVAPLVPFETYTPVRVIECGKIERFLHPNFYTQNQYFVVAKG